MSLDLYLECEHCKQNVGDFNYTYNAGPMWYLACPDDKRMINIEGMTGVESHPKLRAALDKMLSSPTEFKALAPMNGWGDYDGFCEFIQRLIDCAFYNPQLIWRASR